MKSIRICNLRSLEDTGSIDLRPFTLLIGENSSGKSTFLRTFPLLRQSSEMRITGPILWYGQYVDFGSFQDALRRATVDKKISFSFTMTIDKKVLTSPYPGVTGYRRYLGLSRYGDQDNDKLKLFSPFEITSLIEIAYDQKSEGAYTKKYVIKVFDYTIEVGFTSDEKVENLVVNDRDLTYLSNNIMMVHRSGIFPYIYRQISASEASSVIGAEVELFEDELIKKVRGLVDKRTQNETIRKLIRTWIFGDSIKFLRQIQTNAQSLESWKNVVDTWTIENEDYKEVRDLWLALTFRSLSNLLEEYTRQFVATCKYIAPVRARAERYYRIQNLAVDEPDFQGVNLPMFLRNLTEIERRNFSDWTNNLFGFSILTKSNFGHTSLFLKDSSSGEEYNLADTGFGYSQILPILVQLWTLLDSKKNRLIRYVVPRLIAIEQPELHLHPRIQAQLIDAFVKVINEARENGIDIRIVIETHSQTMVNRLGHLIIKGEIEPEEINTLIFEKENDNSPTKIKVGTFDKNGGLTNWPYGFFEPDEVS